MAPAATTAVVVPSASPASALDDQVSPHRAPPDAILVTFAGKTACVPFSCGKLSAAVTNQHVVSLQEELSCLSACPQ
jgi:hypothetical protein